MFIKWKLVSHVIVITSIAVISVIGDIGLKYGKTALMRAVIDNLTHAMVGALTWTLIIILSEQSLIENLSKIFLSFALSSFIDVDHFLCARSWKLSDATQLQGRRPFLHCTTVPILIWLALILGSKIFNWQYLNQYSWIISASFLSHHIRDATRRGLWFYPIGSTRPIPYYLYIIMSMALPYILHWLMTHQIFLPRFSRSQANISIV